MNKKVCHLSVTITSRETHSNSMTQSFRYPDLGFSFCKIWDRKNVYNGQRTESKEEENFFFPLEFQECLLGCSLCLVWMPSVHFPQKDFEILNVLTDSLSFPCYICVKWFTRRKAWLFLLWSPACLILLSQQLPLMPRAKKRWIILYSLVKKQIPFILLFSYFATSKSPVVFKVKEKKEDEQKRSDCFDVSGDGGKGRRETS